MKRPRHSKSRPKFFNEQEPDGLAAELPDLMCDLPDDLRRELPSKGWSQPFETTHGKEES